MLIFFYRERVTTGAIRAHAGSSAQLRVSVFQARRCSSGGSKVKTEARDRDPNVLQLPDDFVTSDDSRGADQPTDRLREVNGARRSNHPRNFLRTCILTLLNAIEQFFKKSNSRANYQWSPFHVVADQGILLLCKYIAEKIRFNGLFFCFI